VPFPGIECERRFHNAFDFAMYTVPRCRSQEILMGLRSMLAAAALLSAILAMPRSSVAQMGTEDGITFDLNANFSNGGTIAGQLFFDPSTGMFASDQLTASGFSSSANGVLFAGIASQGVDDGVDYVLQIDGPSTLELILPVSDPLWYSGPICSAGSDCPAGSTNYAGVSAISSTLDSAATPEPSGALLLATGLLGIGACVRRKIPALKL
jgi:hypothetical protein